MMYEFKLNTIGELLFLGYGHFCGACGIFAVDL